MTSFADVLARHVGSALAKQYALGDVLRAKRYRLDEYRGFLEFDTGQRFPVQLLGRENRELQRWFWDSPDRVPSASPSAFSALEKLQEVGQAEGIEELLLPAVSLNRARGDELALVASQLCEADCYFRIPREGGARYVLLSDTPVCERRVLNPLRIIEVIEKALQLCTLDQEQVIVPFLEQQGFSVARQGEWYMVLTGDSLHVLLRFSPAGEFIEYRSKKIGED